jgi:hypothetical protein
MTTVNTDAKFNGLGKFGYSGVQEDRELTFYKANGATSNSLADAELQFLSSKGFTTGVSEDRWKAYLTSLGYLGTVDDMIRPWWGEFPGSNLALDFTKSTPFTSVSGLDPRITFSRASNATVTGADGTLQYAPHNLLTFSESFDNSVWSKTATNVPANTAAAPNGTTTADKLTPDATLNGHFAVQSFTASSGLVYTSSVYAKADGYSWLRLSFAAATFPASGRAASFNISTGTVGIIQSGVTATIESVGNGWYRCAISATAIASAATNTGATVNNTDSADALAFTGDGTSGIYIWGAQLNVGTLQPYYPTTVKNLLGFTQEFDNAAWTKSNSFVQTNLLLQSEGFDTASWTKIRSSISGTKVTAPNGSLTGQKIVEDTSATLSHAISQAITFVAGSTQTFSVAVKASERNFVVLRFNTSSDNVYAAFNLSTGQTGSTTVSGTASITSTSIQPLGDGWYRCVVVGVPSTTLTSGLALIHTAVSATDPGNTSISYTGDGTSGIFLWGAQLVQGSTPGDYQVTYGTARAVMYPAPDGSVTADKLVEDTATSSHRVLQPFTPTSGTIYTASAYIKAAERGFAFLGFVGGSMANTFVAVNLATGAISNALGTPLSSNSVSLGNGWYRVSVSLASTGTTTSNVDIRVSTNGLWANQSYTGDGTSGIFIWGAQLSDSASLDPYVYNPVAAPAAAAYYGPRFDYDPVTLAPRGLLIEEQRTNLVLQSEAFNDTSVWAVSGVSVTANSGAAPSGQITADKIIPTSFASQFKEVQQNQSVTTGVTYTFSHYLKADGYRYVQLVGSSASFGSFNVNYDLLTGTETQFSAGTSTVVGRSITAAGNGWYRVSVSVTSFITGTGRLAVNVIPAADSARGVSWTGDGTSGVLFWGAQLELGAFPTSYIPTTTAAATRAADVAVMQGANFSNWYRQDEGTLFVEAVGVNNTLGATRRFFEVNDTTALNRHILGYSSTSVTRFLTQALSVTQSDVSISGQQVNANTKIAATYKVNNFQQASNSSLGIADLLGAVPIVFQANFGAAAGDTGSSNTMLNGYLRRVAFFNRQFTDSELQGITS